MADVSKQRLTIGALLAVLVVLVGWGAAINDKANASAADKARMEGRIESLQSTAGDHETRIRTMESGMSEMKADVKWIRSAMERGALAGGR